LNWWIPWKHSLRTVILHLKDFFFPYTLHRTISFSKFLSIMHSACLILVHLRKYFTLPNGQMDNVEYCILFIPLLFDQNTSRTISSFFYVYSICRHKITLSSLLYPCLRHCLLEQQSAGSNLASGMDMCS
jgi:hypothetical protein